MYGSTLLSVLAEVGLKTLAAFVAIPLNNKVQAKLVPSGSFRAPVLVSAYIISGRDEPRIRLCGMGVGRRHVKID